MIDSVRAKEVVFHKVRAFGPSARDKAKYMSYYGIRQKF